MLLEKKVSIFTHVCVSAPWGNVDKKHSLDNYGEGTHPGGNDDVIMEGVVFSYRLAYTVVVFAFEPLLRWPSHVANAHGSSMHCSYT